MRQLTEEEKKIYENQFEEARLEEKSLMFWVEYHGLMFNKGNEQKFKDMQIATEKLLKDYHNELARIQFVLKDCNDKLKNGVEEVEQHE